MRDAVSIYLSEVTVMRVRLRDEADSAATLSTSTWYPGGEDAWFQSGVQCYLNLERK